MMMMIILRLVHNSDLSGEVHNVSLTLCSQIPSESRQSDIGLSTMDDQNIIIMLCFS